jgi:hypothetical protein
MQPKVWAPGRVLLMPRQAIRLKGRAGLGGRCIAAQYSENGHGSDSKDFIDDIASKDILDINGKQYISMAQVRQHVVGVPTAVRNAAAQRPIGRQSLYRPACLLICTPTPGCVAMSHRAVSASPRNVQTLAWSMQAREALEIANDAVSREVVEALQERINQMQLQLKGASAHRHWPPTQGAALVSHSLTAQVK